MAYLVFPIGAALIFGLMLKASPEARANFTLLLAVSGVIVYSAEVYLAILAPADGNEARQKAAMEAGVAFDSRTRLEVVKDMRSRGEEAFSLVTPALLFQKKVSGYVESSLKINGRETIPLGSIARATQILCNESGEYITFKSDRHGFRNPDKVWNAAAGGIAVVGDSFAQGVCVGGEAEAVALIRREAPSTINLGMAGNGPLLELAAFGEYLPRLRPAATLWFYFEHNDLENLADERRTLLINYLDDGFSQMLWDRPGEIDKRMRGYFNERMNVEQKDINVFFSNPRRLSDKIADVVKLGLLRQRLNFAFGKSEKRDVFREEMQLFRKALEKAKSRAAVWGGEIYFVYLPHWGRYADPAIVVDAPLRQLPEHYKQDIEKMTSELGIRFIDMDAAFTATGDPLSLFPYRQMGHYNEKGHALVAKTLIEVLRKNGLIKE